ncbi:MAG: glycine zipper 2TM domain-containing protein [Magnetospirillum sp.]|nr:glycine zipper 2TM domain-containing protein [Magnetospirillum sp.]
MTRISKTVLSLTLASGLVLGGCSGDTGPKQTGGAVLGGVGGAVAGAQFGHGTGRLAAVALGTLLGAFLGSEVGKSLDKADQGYAQKAGDRALESSPAGHTVAWTNPDSGHSGTVTPTRTYEAAPGQFCRDYETTVMIDGRSERALGTACRQPDGSWKVVK